MASEDTPNPFAISDSVVGISSSGGSVTVGRDLVVGPSISEDLSVVFEMPKLAKTFKGREKDIVKLNNIFFGNDKKNTAVISGLPGYGKSELSKKFAKLCLVEKKIKHVFWINLEYSNNETLKHLKSAYSKFQKKRCLFIFDNAVSRKQIIDYEPSSENTNFLFLFTSQESDWGDDIGLIRLEPLNEEASLEVFKEILGNKYKEEDDHLYKELGNIVSNVPLGLQVLAGNLKQEMDAKFNLKEYVTKMQKNEAIFKKTIHRNLANSYKKSMYSAVSASFEKIKQLEDEDEKIRELAHKVLCICPYLNPDSMTFEDINEIINTQGEACTADTLKSALKLLETFSFIDYAVNNDDESIKMYRACQELSRIYFKKMNEGSFQACLQGMLKGSISVNHKSSILLHAENNETLMKNICDTYIGKQKFTKEDDTLQNLLLLLVENGCSKSIKLIFDQMHVSTQKHYIQKYELIHAAAKNNQKELLEIFLQNGNINATDSKGRTPLDVAKKHEASLAAEFLIENEATMNVSDINGASKTPLHKTAKKGQITEITQLTEFAEQLSIKDKYGNTPLFQLVRNCPIDFTKEDWIDILQKSNYQNNMTNNTNVTLLHLAVQKGNMCLIETLFEHVQIDANHQDSDGNTPFHYLNFHSLNPDVIITITKYLIERKASLNIKNKYGVSPGNNLLKYAMKINNLQWFKWLLDCVCLTHTNALHLAVEMGNIQAIHILLKHEVEINAKDDEDNTALHVAAKEGNVEIVHILLTHNSDINVANSKGATALHEAVEEGNIQVMNLLLDSGADINARDNYNSTPLHWASNEVNLEPLVLLLQRGANIHAENNDEAIPLYIAANKGNIEAMNILLFSGSNVNAQNKYKHTSLHLAAHYENLEAMRLLLSYKANPNIQDKDNDTSLHFLVTNGNLEGMTLLLQCGSDANILNNDNTTPLHIAAKDNNIQAMNLLLYCGAKPNIPDKNSKTALHIIAEEGNVEAINLLLNYQADVHAKDNENYTPLVVAIEHDNIDAMCLLLNRGANPDIQDEEKVSALHFAVQLENLRALYYLLNYNAKPNIQDNKYRTPLHWAAKNGNSKAVCMLLQYGANSNIQDIEGNTPLHQIIYNINNLSEEEFKNTFHLLLKSGASLQICNKKSLTPRQLLQKLDSETNDDEDHHDNDNVDDDDNDDDDDDDELYNILVKKIAALDSDSESDDDDDHDDDDIKMAKQILYLLSSGNN